MAEELDGHDDLTPTHTTGAAGETIEHPHTPADDREIVYYEGSPLVRGELGKLLLYGVVGILLIAVPFMWRLFHSPHQWPVWWVTLIFVVLGIICLVIPLVQQKAVRYRITNYRIDYERGLMSRNIDTLELWHVEDIQFHQSLMDRILNVGNITVLSHDDTTPKLELHSVPNPRPVFEALKQRIISVKRQRGVVKMDVGN
jgi:membrane protein YdbS with pleckstrin-like domain